MTSRIRVRLAGVALALVAAGLVSSCREGRASATPDKSGKARVVQITARDCFPTEARRWISLRDASTARSTAGGSAATVYIDGSGSMVGYLRAGRPGERPFEELVSDVPGSIGAVGGQIDYVLFGKDRTPLPPPRIDALARVETYACNGKPGCDNQESRLDLVFDAIANAGADELSVIITDLWLQNSDLTAGGSAAFAAPIRRIFDSGRSVVVYGLAAPYQGTIADLPSGRKDVVAQKRPLFVVAVGSRARLDRLDDDLKRSPRPLIHQAFSSGSVKKALFTRTPETDTAAPAQPFVIRGTGGIGGGAFLPAREGLQLQQLQVSRGAARRDRAAADRRGAADRAGGPSWVGPQASAMAEGAVWTGQLDVKTRVWKQTRESAQCRPTDWQPGPTITRGWSGDGAQRTFTLDPAVIADALTPGTYLIVGEVGLTSLEQPNPATEWMREWGFSPADEADVLSAQPAVFPTLNLGEMARLLENSLSEPLRDGAAGGEGIAGFAVALRVTN